MTEISAIRIAKHGDPSLLELTTTAMPVPEANQILIQHHAIGVNFIDTYHRSGLYQLPMPSGLGLEAAGEVIAVGSDVSDWAVGDRAAYCTGPIGAYSSAHCVASDRAVKLPDSIPYDSAASMMLKGLTTQYLIRQIYKVSAGDTVLFHAGAGGVGQLAIQWLKHIGATVITTVGSEPKAEIVRKLGADHVINYQSEDIAKRVCEVAPGGLPVVFDGVGKDTFIASLDCLQPKGLLVSFGNASGPVKDVDLGILAAKGSLFVTRPTLFSYTSTREALQAAADDLFAAIDAGGIALPQPTVYPLAEAAQAHRDLEARKTTGSLILKP
ncbi:quinone oxidoreductase [Rhodobacteraceae bacterium NNCM2]|nr:quinone oxidoreductase [Coraliihabitans acroporae]